MKNCYYPVHEQEEDSERAGNCPRGRGRCIYSSSCLDRQEQEQKTAKALKGIGKKLTASLLKMECERREEEKRIEEQIQRKGSINAERLG